MYTERFREEIAERRTKNCLHEEVDIQSSTNRIGQEEYGSINILEPFGGAFSTCQHLPSQRGLLRQVQGTWDLHESMWICY